MQKNLLSFKLCSLVIIFILFLPIACKKGDSDPAIPKENILVLDKTTVTPGDLVKVNYELPKDKSSWEMLIGEKKVTLTKIDDTTAAFLVPVIPSGQLNLDFSIVGAKEKPTLTISAYSPITNPDQVKDAYLAQLDDAITDVSSTEDANTLTVFKETFKAKYAALTDTEKKELAFVLQKLNFDMPDISEQAIHTKSTNGLGIDVPAKFNSDQEYRAGVIAYVGLATESMALLALSAEAIAAPTGYTQVLGLAGLGASFYTFKKALDYKKVLFAYNGQNKQVINLKILLSGQNSNTKTAEAVTTAEPEFVFQTGVQRSFNVSSAYQGVSIADEKSTNAFFRNIVLVTNKATSIYNGVVKAVNRIKSWFSGDPKLIELASGIATTPTEETRNSPANLIKIENVSDPEIKITYTTVADILKITATGNVKDIHTFTFDVVYSYPAMGISNRKKITAKYEPKDGLGWYAGDYTLAMPSALSLIQGGPDLGKKGSFYVYFYYNEKTLGYNSVFYAKSILPGIPNIIGSLWVADIRDPQLTFGGGGWEYILGNNILKKFEFGPLYVARNEKLTTIDRTETSYTGSLSDCDGGCKYSYEPFVNAPYQGKTAPSTLTAAELKAINDFIAAGGSGKTITF
ncbi:hypothetical protein C3K47_15735 [Solitalea longa]|uniref:Uncharacterized protein n=1 Tax=Solitalea longa TaxID=2079460 RepID=A0A2S4ZY09_9SPHI|nr:hypothetical protein [Solitalea longa]POY35234.1 hypothetical protein C3K47_15735 [Solitalea longa]